MSHQQPLRTLHVDTERIWRGGEQQALYLATGLAQRGHVAHCVGRTGAEFPKRCAEAGLETFDAKLSGEINPFAILRLRKIVERGRYDLVHAHTAHAHSLAAAACRLSGGIPCIVSRRVDFALKKKPFGLNRLKYGSSVARYIAISEAVKRVLVDGGVEGSRIDIVPSGIDLERHRHADRSVLLREFGIPADVPVIGTVGHCAWHKGFETLIDAAPIILARRPSARFVLVGDGELRAELEARAHARAPGLFTFTGFRPDVASFLSRFDVFTAPSLLEGLNTSILDALGLARPVVASRVGGIPEAVEHEVTGLLAEPRDVQGLAAAILRMLDDRGLAARLGAAGRERVLQRFSIDSLVDGTLAVYRSVLALHARSIAGSP